MNISLLLCGGTIDKTYVPSSESLEFRETHFPQMIEQSRITGPKLIVEKIMLKDSLEMTYKDRNLVLKAVQNSDSQFIIIAHGTSTMTETAEFLQAHISNKTIVLFGAMVPYEFTATSDALFNFGMAMGAVQSLSNGVYISMNGKVWEAGTVKKDHVNAEFCASL